LVLLISLLLTLLAGWAVFWRDINRLLTVNLLLRAPSAREEVFEEVVGGTDDPVGFLERCWATGKVPHRQWVASYLRGKAGENAPWYARAEELLLEGAVEPDLSVREMALGALQLRAHPRLLDCARAQLAEVDPLLRQLGLDYLRRFNAREGVPLAVELLDDSDLRVAISAELALMNWTGLDFGVRARMAVASGDAGEAAKLENLPAIRQGLEKRKQWWRAHGGEYPSPQPAAAPLRAEAIRDRALEDFRLRDLEGKSFRLSDFRGRPVMLSFWATWCAACVGEIPALNALNRRLGDRGMILAIALDGAGDDHGKSVGGNADQGPGNESAREAVVKRVARAVRVRGITYPVLLDPESAVGRRYNASELPATVNIDSEGRLRRRFVGPRSADVLEAMMREARGLE
jgi:thiol-disulfide isomerase/thioredoxin